MSSRAGASGESRPSRAGNCGPEDAGGGSGAHAPCFKAVSPGVGGVGGTNPEGRPSSVGKPAWPERTPHRKTCGRETREDAAQGRQEEQRAGSVSGVQPRGLEAGEGSSGMSGSHLGPRPSQRASPRTADHHRSSRSSPRDPDLFWANVRREAAAGQSSQTRITTVTSSGLGDEEEEEEEEEDQGAGEEEEEGGRGLLEVMGRGVTLALVPPASPFGERRTSKRERNRTRCLRRRQRRRERWRQSQQESRQSSTGNPSSSGSEDDEDPRDRDGYVCAVCLDVYFSPYMCHPCSHVFCEPCLRTLAKNCPTNTPCPLCRTVITHVFFQKELSQTARTFFPKEYLTRKQNFQKASCAKWPLPSCRKLFRIFGGFQRPSSPVARRQIPRGGRYRVDALDFEDRSQGWRFDLDMIVIYIYSVNWVIGFFLFCFLCYLFFPSF
ncbi:E3 ubiquitin-protein ligase RNF180 isoform X2 [Betta splendens]|uniref:E3 ubiquitin-protein ligase RNF180 n=1 Tax=Betta splendens TaxID=158456 RepID=A0A6P7NM56_BETSP|nr:E3 ubiquitin-protein ligase RNF180 isoform X2 [Betta splendens]